jgi:trypsin
MCIFKIGTQDINTGEILKPERYFIRAGSTQKHSGGTIHTVSNVYVHPKFRAGENKKHHDVGLLKLADPIKLSDKSQLVKLIDEDTSTEVGDKATLAGWGNDPIVPHDYHLNQIEYTVIDSKSCAKEIATDTEAGVEKHEICAKSPGASGCEGDSGGPLINTETNEQIGITSFISSPCTTTHVPKLTVFSSIRDNLDYINQIIKQSRRRS